MLFIDRAETGDPAWRRMIRDGVILPLTTVLAAPADLEITPPIRAQAICRFVPEAAAVSGVSALWVWGAISGPLPRRIEVAVPRGANPSAPAAVPVHYRWHAVTDSEARRRATNSPFLAVITPAHAAVTALMRADHTVAIPAVYTALKLGVCSADEIGEVIAATARRTAGYTRLCSAWKEIRRLSRDIAPG